MGKKKTKTQENPPEGNPEDNIGANDVTKPNTKNPAEAYFGPVGDELNELLVECRKNDDMDNGDSLREKFISKLEHTINVFNGILNGFPVDYMGNHPFPAKDKNEDDGENMNNVSYRQSVRDKTQELTGNAPLILVAALAYEVAANAQRLEGCKYPPSEEYKEVYDKRLASAMNYLSGIMERLEVHVPKEVKKEVVKNTATEVKEVVQKTETE